MQRPYRNRSHLMIEHIPLLPEKRPINWGYILGLVVAIAVTIFLSMAIQHLNRW